MSALRRLAIGPFSVDKAVRGDDLASPAIEAKLLSPLLAVGDLPRITLSDEEIARVSAAFVTLYRSQLSSAGPSYTALARARLSG